MAQIHALLFISDRPLTAEEIAEQLGMTSLSIAAKNVTQTIDQGDEVAKAATLTRLFRIGEQSLMAVWDVQDMSLV